MPHEADLSAGSEPASPWHKARALFPVWCIVQRVNHTRPPARRLRGRAIEAAIRIFSKHMTLEENLRPALDAKAKSLGESGSFYFHDGPNVSCIIDAKPEQCQCFVGPARVRGRPLPTNFTAVLLRNKFRH